MYRIELSPGEETAFRSIEELAVAIRRGIVTPRARIYHNATSTWLPIQYHPHYKLAFTMPLTQAALVAGPPAKPLSGLTLQVTPAPLIPAAAPEQPEAPKKSKRARKKRQPSEDQARPAARTQPRQRGPSRRTVRLAFAGALLIACTQLALSAATPLNSKSSRAHRKFIVSAPTQVPKQSAPAIPTTLAVSLPKPALPAAPKASKSAPKAGPVPTARNTPLRPTAQPAATVSPDSAAVPVIEPAPASIELAVPTVAGVESLTRKLVDTSDKKTLKKILRAVSGAPAQARPTR
jgi:hypothetical protein